MGGVDSNFHMSFFVKLSPKSVYRELSSALRVFSLSTSPSMVAMEQPLLTIALLFLFLHFSILVNSSPSQHLQIINAERRVIN